MAEDAVVADLLSGGRIDLGLGSGGTPSSFVPFGQDASTTRRAVYDEKLATLLDARCAGDDIGGGQHPATRMPGPSPIASGRRPSRSPGGTRAGVHGHGLLLSRTQPRPADEPHAHARGASRTRSSTPTSTRCPARRRAADHGIPHRLRRRRPRATRCASPRSGCAAPPTGFRRAGQTIPGDTLDELIASLDTHLGTPEQVAESLAADATLARATEVAFQVHSVDAPHDFVLRSIELVRHRGRARPRLGDARPPSSTTALRKEIA